MHYWENYFNISGGNSKTLLITQVAPGDSHVSETLQTLQFAQRIRSIQCLSSNSKSRERLDSERSDKSENSKNKETDDEVNLFPNYTEFVKFLYFSLDIQGATQDLGIYSDANSSNVVLFMAQKACMHCANYLIFRLYIVI